MNGNLLPGTPIAVDFWKSRACGGVKLFFLTHVHGDHIVGLSSSWDRPIYCSRISAKLLISRYEMDPELLITLEENESHLLTVSGKYITVTVFNANHCPGAVMYLFEGDFGKILHTGDFRYCKSMIEDTVLKKHLATIDVLYVDNTYCSPECDFLTRNEACKRILEVIDKHKGHDIVFGMRNLGKEELLVKVALTLNEWIAVPGKTLETAEVLGLPNVFVTSDDTASCRLRVVPFSHVTSKRLTTMNLEKPTIAILPTALYTGADSLPSKSDIFVIPYSDHSSYSELLTFVAHIRPKRIVPIVSSNARGPSGKLDSRANMSCFDHLLNCSSPEVLSKRRKQSQSFSTMTGQNSQCVTVGVKLQDSNCKKRNRYRFVKRSTKMKVKGINYDSDSDLKTIELNGLIDKDSTIYVSKSSADEKKLAASIHDGVSSITLVEPTVGQSFEQSELRANSGLKKQSRHQTIKDIQNDSNNECTETRFELNALIGVCSANSENEEDRVHEILTSTRLDDQTVGQCIEIDNESVNTNIIGVKIQLQNTKQFFKVNEGFGIRGHSSLGIHGSEAKRPSTRVNSEHSLSQSAHVPSIKSHAQTLCQQRDMLVNQVTVNGYESDRYVSGKECTSSKENLSVILSDGLTRKKQFSEFLDKWLLDDKCSHNNNS